MRASILIVHADRKTQRIVQRILGAAGHPIDVADDCEQATRLMAHLNPVLVVVDGMLATAPSAAELFAAAAAKNAEAVMMLGTTAATQSAIPEILRTGAVMNLLVHPTPILNEELAITAMKLIRGDLFGLEKYLLWGTTIETSTITHSRQRADFVHALAEQVRARNQTARVASTAMLVADELISNAVHNAPVDAAGAHYRSELARDSDFELDAKHAVRVRWGCDARYLAVEVTDPFGSLERETILRALGKSEVRESGQGAGMGIALAYRSCDHLIFNLAPGRCSEIIALLDVRYPAAERMAASSYNIFVERGGKPA